MAEGRVRITLELTLLDEGNAHCVILLRTCRDWATGRESSQNLTELGTILCNRSVVLLCTFLSVCVLSLCGYYVVCPACAVVFACCLPVVASASGRAVIGRRLEINLELPSLRKSARCSLPRVLIQTSSHVVQSSLRQSCAPAMPAASCALQWQHRWHD